MLNTRVEKQLSIYEQTDFKYYYEREYFAHKKTSIKLKQALDRINDLEKASLPLKFF